MRCPTHTRAAITPQSFALQLFCLAYFPVYPYHQARNLACMALSEPGPVAMLVQGRAGAGKRTLLQAAAYASAMPCLDMLDFGAEQSGLASSCTHDQRWRACCES